MFFEAHVEFSRTTDPALSSPQKLGTAPPNGVKSLQRLYISLVLAWEQLVLHRAVQGAGPM